MLTHVWNLMRLHPFANEDAARFVRRARIDHGHHVQLVEALEAGNGRKVRDVLIDRIAHAKETLAEWLASWEVVGSRLTNRKSSPHNVTGAKEVIRRDLIPN